MNRNQIAEKLAETTLTIGAFKLRPEDPFRWASGYYMPIYNDNRMLLGNAEHRRLVADGFAAIIAENSLTFDVVCGTATAGIAPATTLADRLAKPLAYVRDKAKGHGMQNRVEGILNPGQKCLVIEDVVSTGGSSVSAVEGVRESGGTVEACLAIYNYGFPKAEKLFSDAQCKLLSVLDFAILISTAEKMKKLTAEAAKELHSWYENPFEWGVKRGYPAPEPKGTEPKSTESKN